MQSSSRGILISAILKNLLFSILEYESIYSSQLDNNSLKYCRDWCSSNDLPYYYAAVLLIPSATANYEISCNSTITIYAYLYQNNFDPSQPLENQVATDNNYHTGASLALDSRLNASTVYIIVVTTAFTYQTGSFSIMGSGAAEVIFSQMSKCIPPPSLLIGYWTSVVQEEIIEVAFKSFSAWHQLISLATST